MTTATSDRASGGDRRLRPRGRPLRPSVPERIDDATPYAGLVTRTVAFVLDAVVINLMALLATGALGIALSVLVGDPEISGDGVVAGAVAFGLWSVVYFVVGWSVGGQTIGNAVMGIRVLDARTGLPPRPGRALIRLIGISVGAIPFLAGIWILLWDRRRRALHDRIARSVVVRVGLDDRPPGRSTRLGP